MKIIFLDIDGVLNSINWRSNLIGHIFIKFKQTRRFWYWWDAFGVRTYRVFLLKILILLTGADVVLSSSWRNGWYSQGNELRHIRILRRKFRHFNINVVGITPSLDSRKRQEEINAWLLLHKKVTNFVILDDESADLQKYVGTHLVKTSSKKEVTKNVPRYNGLKIRHIIQAYKILNSCT